MDVREQGMNWLWMRVVYRTNRQKHERLKDALNEFIKQCKRTERSAREQGCLI